MARVIKPLHQAPFSSVMRRVTYHLIRGDYFSRPADYARYAPDAVYTLGQRYRAQFPYLFPWFLYFSKNMAHGLTTAFLRDCEIEEAPRVVHKRRIHRPPS